MPLSFFETWQLITCENGKEDKQFDNCYCLKCVYFFTLFMLGSSISIDHTKNNDQQMINGRCFLLPNVSHYDLIQHHLSSTWSISSIHLSSVQQWFSICSPIDMTSDVFFSHFYYSDESAHKRPVITMHLLNEFIPIDLLINVSISIRMLGNEMQRLNFCYCFSLEVQRVQYCGKVDAWKFLYKCWSVFKMLL